MDVLVVGAGPAGLVAAIALLQHGVRVRVIDKAAGPARTSRANILHARGSEVLERLGAVGDLRERSLPAMSMSMYAGGSLLAKITFGDVADLSAHPALYTSQANVEDALRRRLADLGGAIEWDTALTGAEQDTDGVTVTLGTGERTRVPWLVGGDGTHSAVRKLAGIGFPGVPVGEEWLLADVHVDWPADRDGGHGWLHRDGMAAVLPMRDLDGTDQDLWRAFLHHPLPAGAEPDEAEILRLVRADVAARTTLPDTPFKDAVWTSAFRVHRRLADTYRRGRMLLAGDAAHLHSPFGGQGMLTGVGDAENLAWKLALVVHGRADAALLDTYEAERRPLATEVVKRTSDATRMLAGEGLMARVLRDRVFAPIMRMRSMQRRATLSASQLGVTYRRGPLGGRASRAPRPGDRVPDGSYERDDGTATGLYGALRGSWAVLTRTDGDPYVTAARAALGDRVATLTSADHPDGEAWLIRPDGHLAWRGTDAGALRRRLEAVLGDGTAHR